MRRLLFLFLVFSVRTYAQEITLNQLSKDTFVHTSYLQTEDFGHVPCNGLVIRNGGEAIILDSPTDDRSAYALIRLVQDSLHCRIIAVVPTHFHNDCLGGLNAFHARGIPSFASELTRELAQKSQMTVPQNTFHDTLTLQVGAEKVLLNFLGQGHTRDNVVGYFPKDHVLFGGCLIKEIGATKGYLGDANVTDWPATVRRVKDTYPKVKHVVPGHGATGNASLLDYTIQLFSKK
jgi:metallo-beta-lactamase class B